LRYTLYWQFYLGRHWAWKREEGETQLTLNYVKAFVNKGLSFTIGKGFDWILPDDTRAVVGPILSQIWKDNNKDLWAWECFQMGAVTGDAFVKVTWEEPTPYNGLKRGRIRLINLNSSHCFPIWDNHDKTLLKEFRIIYEYDAPGRTVERTGETQRVKFIEILTKDRSIIKDGDKPEQIIEHNLGFVPIVHIKNVPVAGAFFGVSDCADLITVNRELNEKVTNISDIINYHQAPVTLIFGARATNLEKGANKVWSGLPKDARVENLNMTTDLSGSNSYMQFIKQAMHEIGNVPEPTLGEQQAISNTSGVALQIQYQPLIELKQIKSLTYGTGISAINSMALRLYEIKTGVSIRELLQKNGMSGEAVSEIDPYENKVFFRDTLPKDRNEILQEISTRMATPYPLITPPMALKMLGEENPEKIIKEIEEWRSAMAPSKIEDGDSVGDENTQSTETPLIAASQENGIPPEASTASNFEGGNNGVNLGIVRTGDFQGPAGISSYNPLGL
jgi:hypothetical protein